jgi:hypothetical protein
MDELKEKYGPKLLSLIKTKLLVIKEKHSSSIKADSYVLNKISLLEGDKFINKENLIFGTSSFFYTDSFFVFKKLDLLIYNCKLVIYPYYNFSENVKIKFLRNMIFEKQFILEDNEDLNYRIINKVEEYSKNYDHFNEKQKEILEDVLKQVNIAIIEFEKDLELQIANKKIKKQQILNSKQEEIKKEFIEDNKNKIDIIDVKDDFHNLIKNHQTKIIDTDKTFIQKFIKISNYHKQKKENLKNMFDSITSTKNLEELEELKILLKQQIHTYEIIILHSFNMLTALIDDDLITFYEIYEAFDELNMFDSNHQKELSEKLTNIEDGIYNLVKSNVELERNMTNKLISLSYLNISAYKELTKSLNKKLASIGSAINTNTLLNAINAYSSYSTNKRLSK